MVWLELGCGGVWPGPWWCVAGGEGSGVESVVVKFKKKREREKVCGVERRLEVVWLKWGTVCGGW